MKVVVKFLRDAYPGLDDWRRSLGRSEAERAAAYPAHLTALNDLFVAAGGVPVGSVRHDESDRPVWWLEYGGRLTVRFVLGERPPRPRGWWDVRRWSARLRTPPVRIVTVIGVSVADSSAGGFPRS